MAAIVPKKTVDDYTKSELEAFQREFLPIVEKYKEPIRLDGKAKYIYFGGIISWVLLVTLFGKSFGIAIAWITLLFLLLLIFLLFLSGLFRSSSFPAQCPACGHEIGKIDGNYCPACGTEGTINSGFFDPTSSCGWCDAKLSRGKGGRKYIIRHCNCCGILLYQPGL